MGKCQSLWLHPISHTASSTWAGTGELDLRASPLGDVSNGNGASGSLLDNKINGSVVCYSRKNFSLPTTCFIDVETEARKMGDWHSQISQLVSGSKSTLTIPKARLHLCARSTILYRMDVKLGWLARFLAPHPAALVSFKCGHSLRSIWKNQMARYHSSVCKEPQLAGTGSLILPWLS